MHVLQYVAYKLDDEVPTPSTPDEIEEAKQEAVNVLSIELNDSEVNAGLWFDYVAVGGGRWNDESDGEDNPINMVLSYAEDKGAFLTMVESMKLARSATFEKMKSEVLKFDLKSALTLDEDFDGVRSLGLYQLRQTIALVNHRWTGDSCIYDWHNYTGDLQHMMKDIAKDGNRWFLIPVDFHC